VVLVVGVVRSDPGLGSSRASGAYARQQLGAELAEPAEAVLAIAFAVHVALVVRDGDVARDAVVPILDEMEHLRCGMASELRGRRVRASIPKSRASDGRERRRVLREGGGEGERRDEVIGF
jgi:hypothetical protein